MMFGLILILVFFILAISLITKTIKNVLKSKKYVDNIIQLIIQIFVIFMLTLFIILILKDIYLKYVLI
jgi:hypothetical protein